MRPPPHVYVPGPWEGDTLGLGHQTRHHLEGVLRRSSGETVSYTDGAGSIGVGLFAGGAIERGTEQQRTTRSGIHVVVAPPRKTERVRILVEKLVELGVESIQWLDAIRRQTKDPRPEKCFTWAVSAVEQSGGAWLPELGGARSWNSLSDAGVWVADGNAPGTLPHSMKRPVTVVIGPEGGFAPDEVPASLDRFSMAGTVLRIETAAVSAVTLVIDRLR